MKCLDHPEDLELWGNYASPNTANLVIAFDKCNNQTSNVTCKSEKEIREWMRFKYIILGFNNRRFIKDGFNDDRIQESMRAQWYPMSDESRVDYVTKVTRTTIRLNDNQYSYAGLAIEQKDGFFIEDFRHN